MVFLEIITEVNKQSELKCKFFIATVTGNCAHTFYFTPQPVHLNILDFSGKHSATLQTLYRDN